MIKFRPKNRFIHLPKKGIFFELIHHGTAKHIISSVYLSALKLQIVQVTNWNGFSGKFTVFR